MPPGLALRVHGNDIRAVGRHSQAFTAHLVGTVAIAAVESLDEPSQGSDERITLHRPPRLLGHAASMPSACIEYVTAIARADHTSRLIP
jgi:hypothetical protein